MMRRACLPIRPKPLIARFIDEGKDISTVPYDSVIENLLSPFSTNIIWMSLESAEMTKHALNAFLATSVTFINELANKPPADESDTQKQARINGRDNAVEVAIGPRRDKLNREKEFITTAIQKLEELNKDIKEGEEKLQNNSTIIL